MIYNKLKQLPTFLNLTADQQALISMRDIRLEPGWFGRLEIIFVNHGAEKSMAVSGFNWF